MNLLPNAPVNVETIEIFAPFLAEIFLPLRISFMNFIDTIGFKGRRIFCERHQSTLRQLRFFFRNLYELLKKNTLLYRTYDNGV